MKRPGTCKKQFPRGRYRRDLGIFFYLVREATTKTSGFGFCKGWRNIGCGTGKHAAGIRHRFEGLDLVVSNPPLSSIICRVMLATIPCIALSQLFMQARNDSGKNSNTSASQQAARDDGCSMKYCLWSTATIVPLTSMYLLSTVCDIPKCVPDDFPPMSSHNS